MQHPNSNNNSNNGHRRNTPGRRRQSRNATQSPALASHQRNYASENDVADLLGDAAFRKDASGNPQTPRKASPSSLHPNSQAKPRAANKQRSKNAAASPIPMKSGRKTPPPPVAVSARTSSSTAFAGATFHASPAPSSLPIPSFMAKSMPDSPGVAGSRPRTSQEPSPPPTDSEMPTPAHRSSAASRSQEESPLDIFFRADRAEKEKARRASSANIGVHVFGPFSPPSQPRSPLRAGPSAATDGPFQPGRVPTQRNSSTGSPAAHMHDTAPMGMGPAFSTPYSERIKAARSTDKPARRSPETAHHQQQSAVDRSEALKKFLFGGQKQALPASPIAAASPLGMPALNGGPRPPRPQTQHVYGTPNSNDGSERRSANLLAFEDDLRRMLKLDSPLSLAAQQPALANAHTS